MFNYGGVALLRIVRHCAGKITKGFSFSVDDRHIKGLKLSFVEESSVTLFRKFDKT